MTIAGFESLHDLLDAAGFSVRLFASPGGSLRAWAVVGAGGAPDPPRQAWLSADSANIACAKVAVDRIIREATAAADVARRISAMTQQADASRHSCQGAKGAYGNNLAATFHLKESEHVSTAWPGDNPFAITRLQSATGIPDRTTRVASEAALLVSVAILPVPLRAYELWIDGKAIDLPYIPSFRTNVVDLQSDPVCWVGAGFDYVHYHVPRVGLDEIARDHGIEPVAYHRYRPAQPFRQCPARSAVGEGGKAGG
jgi:hypothetical protein